MYSIERNLSKKRVLLQLDKYEDHDGPRFVKELQSAALSVKGSGDHFDILADFSNSIVMPQDVANDSEAIAQWLLENGLRRSANVSQSITQHMQVKRVTKKDDKFGLFATRAEAEKWLEQ